MMKYCPNPACDPSFFYGSTKSVCPFCHTSLSERIDNDRVVRPIITPENIYINEDNVHPGEEDVRESFSTRIRGGIRYHGRITEIEHHEVFNSKWHKIFNSLFRGEPYQFAHQTSEYTVRIEDITDGYPDDVADVCMYGNYLGRMHVGDEITVNTKVYRNRRVAKSVYNHTTDSGVRAGLQLPAGLIRAIAIGMVTAVSLILAAIFVVIRTGALTDWLASLFASLLPVIIVGIVIFEMVIGRLPGRKR